MAVPDGACEAAVAAAEEGWKERRRRRKRGKRRRRKAKTKGLEGLEVLGTADNRTSAGRSVVPGDIRGNPCLESGQFGTGSLSTLSTSLIEVGRE